MRGRMHGVGLYRFGCFDVVFTRVEVALSVF
jgi:hypothetical protein